MRPDRHECFELPGETDRAGSADVVCRMAHWSKVKSTEGLSYAENTIQRRNCDASIVVDPTSSTGPFLLSHRLLCRFNKVH